MKLHPLRLAGTVTGQEIFRIASVCLYITLLLHAVLAAFVNKVMLSDLSVVAVSVLVTLFFAALARYFWPNAIPFGRARLLIEWTTCIFVIASLAFQQSMPAQPLPWLIGLAGIFPLAVEAPLAIGMAFTVTFIEASLNITLGTHLVDWLPQLFATIFMGLSSIFLADALASNAKAIQQAHHNQRRFDAIARAARHVFLIADSRFRIKFANRALREVIGYAPEEIDNDLMRPIFHPDDRKAHRRKLRYLRDTPHSSIFSRHRTRHKDGHWVWLETRGYNMLHDDAINGFVFSVEDISARKDAETRLEEEHALLRAVLDLNPSMIYATDREGRFTISNQTFQRRFGYPSEGALRGKTISDIFCAAASRDSARTARELAERLYRQDLQVIQSSAPQEDQEIQCGWENGLPNWYRVNKYPLRDTRSEVVGVLCISRDITDRKEYEMRLQHQALHDPLTGLPNRRYLLKTISDVIANTSEASRQIAMLFCDLDFFKSVNDIHGHDFGDKCLTEITRRILAELPTDDFVARFGGNEFVILSNATLDEAKVKAEVLLQAVSQQLAVDGTVVKIQTSIGIALLDPEHKNPSELIRDADAAMYQAKERGRNRAEIFDASLQSCTTKRAQMDVALRFALERDELALVYQPKVSILNGALKGFELLLRWNNPQYGMIPPMEFIPVAESSGLVVPIGLWVLEEACKQLRRWQDEYPGMDRFTIAVNVSMRQLLQSTFLADVKDILERTGVDPNSIELELTETSAMANPVQTIETLSVLKGLGFRLALDDFGTGYSSLSYLHRLPIDVLKIDKTFVQGLDKNPSDAEIVRLILALAQTLNLDTVAEGVETREDMLQLKKMGCYLAQGFAFSPPVPAQDAEELLRTSQHFQVA
ncbi:MAG TPA: EAL domain-containing protein [Noviherbaspirillum sp.]|uniref:putative bifunctional diguanylate cyclase/phosphodiesterase n=1 Tax=Noviherbaspirillum sp. TaxID=1926288 RepID=UPI002B49699C|nr:EAL domain-containing protein [Noviherbaspirillum sp.]HJV87151.1 EAL domain-containing protein [Noviherbaspirillum sp.]